MHTNLRNHVTDKSGSWHSTAERFGAERLELASPEDEVELAGPLSINLSVQGVHTMDTIAGGSPTTLSREIYNYDVDIPAGRKLRYRLAELSPFQPGAVTGSRVVIRPTLAGRPPLALAPFDLPCDFAVGSIPDTGAFFPAGCESCPPGSTVIPPPVCGPTLAVPAARGGCIRPRFFNGMFITREDLETQLRYLRMKLRLHNRAAGEGVVWGLAVSRRGSKVVVEPGYAVDCCGNDLTVTCDYGVDVGTLLADPAVCRLVGPEPRRLHLLLEYVECPEEPRPIHGDACSTQQTGCELSRVRETVRLRLVPPRDLAPDGAVQAFLDEVKRLRDSRSLLTLLRRPDLVRRLIPPPLPEVPFDVDVRVSTNPQSLVLVPPLAPTPAVEGDIPFGMGPVGLELRARAAFLVIRVTLRAHPGFTFDAAMPVTTRYNDNPVTPPAPVENLVQSPTEMAWTFSPDKVSGWAPQGNEDIPPQFTFELDGWRMSSGTGYELKGRTEIDLTLLLQEVWRRSAWGRAHLRDAPEPPQAPLFLHARIPPSEVVVVEPPRPRPWPCLEEPCAADGTPLFPVPPPWLHEDPSREGRAADPKVLILSVLYVWLVGEMDRHRQGTPEAIVTVRLQLALWVYLSAWRLFFDVVTDDDRREATVALQQLLASWCRSFLYPGPQCAGEPHGVVIGCAEVKAGDICAVDPWGGRRWVVHYPLLAHWGEQIGLVPLDVTASRLVSLICCFSGLPLPALRLPERRGPVLDRDPSSRVAMLRTNAPVVDVGGGRLVLGTDADVQALGVKLERIEPLGVLALARRVLAALGEPAPPAAGPWVDYRLVPFPEVHFLAPAPAAAPAAPPSTPPRITRNRFTELIRSTLADRPARATIPPLLRDLAESVSTRLLAVVPPPMPADSPIRSPLALAGLTSIAALLTQPPDEIHAKVLNRAHGRALSEVLADSEEKARAVTTVVGNTALEMGGRKRLASLDDLRSEAVRREFVERVGKGARVDVDEVAKVVEALLRDAD